MVVAVEEVEAEALLIEAPSGSLAPSTAILVNPRTIFPGNSSMQALAREMQGSHGQTCFLQLL
jgi:hypothetical protein